MTSKEALEGFQSLSRRFGKAYKGEDLNRVWKELLSCHHSAFVRAIGIMLKRCQFLPDPEYVLQQTRWWQQNLKFKIEHETREEKAGRDLDTEAKEAMGNLRAMMSGEITQGEYRRRLFEMSERYGDPSYALTAEMVRK
jgi:hypothetical protein